MRDFFSLERWLPGLAALLQYQRAWLMPDLRAGLSVAAVALPVAIAYAELAGVGAIVGLYSCILPMVVYALFGTSRQLIVGPDAATCAVIAAVVTPLAAGAFWAPARLAAPSSRAAAMAPQRPKAGRREAGGTVIASCSRSSSMAVTADASASCFIWSIPRFQDILPDGCGYAAAWI